MDNSSSPAVCLPSLPIPVDLFMSKKNPDYFTNSTGDTIYRVNRLSSKSSSAKKRVLLDAAGNPLISVVRSDKGSWQGFKGDNTGEQNLLFRVHREVNKLLRTEYNITIIGRNSEDSTSGMKMRGFPFQRSCTIYENNAIVAQTNLMHKLNQVFVSRGKFRLTIFPGSIDPVLIVALIVIFFDGRR